MNTAALVEGKDGSGTNRTSATLPLTELLFGLLNISLYRVDDLHAYTAGGSTPTAGRSLLARPRAATVQPFVKPRSYNVLHRACFCRQSANTDEYFDEGERTSDFGTVTLDEATAKERIEALLGWAPDDPTTGLLAKERTPTLERAGACATGIVMCQQRVSVTMPAHTDGELELPAHLVYVVLTLTMSASGGGSPSGWIRYSSSLPAALKTREMDPSLADKVSVGLFVRAGVFDFLPPQEEQEEAASTNTVARLSRVGRSECSLGFGRRYALESSEACVSSTYFGLSSSSANDSLTYLAGSQGVEGLLLAGSPSSEDVVVRVVVEHEPSIAVAQQSVEYIVDGSHASIPPPGNTPDSGTGTGTGTGTTTAGGPGVVVTPSPPPGSSNVAGEGGGTGDRNAAVAAGSTGAVVCVGLAVFISWRTTMRKRTRSDRSDGTDEQELPPYDMDSVPGDVPNEDDMQILELPSGHDSGAGGIAPALLNTFGSQNTFQSSVPSANYGPIAKQGSARYALASSSNSLTEDSPILHRIRSDLRLWAPNSSDGAAIEAAALLLANHHVRSMEQLVSLDEVSFVELINSTDSIGARAVLRLAARNFSMDLTGSNQGSIMGSLNGNTNSTSSASVSTGKYMALATPLGPAVPSPASASTLPTASPGALHGQATGTTWDQAAAAAQGGTARYGAEFASAGGHVPGYHSQVVLGPNGVPMLVYPQQQGAGGVIQPPGMLLQQQNDGGAHAQAQLTPGVLYAAGGAAGHDKKRSKKASHPYQCSICLECFNRPARVREHLMSKHNVGERIPCPRCSETFVRKENLRKHMARAHNEKPT